MFLGSDFAPVSQGIANLFAVFFQGVYVQDDWITDSDLSTPDNSHKMSTFEIFRSVSGRRRQQRTRLGRNFTSYFETVGFGCQSSFYFRF
jgi:hypothetical protein